MYEVRHIKLRLFLISFLMILAPYVLFIFPFLESSRIIIDNLGYFSYFIGFIFLFFFVEGFIGLFFWFCTTLFLWSKCKNAFNRAIKRRVIRLLDPLQHGDLFYTVFDLASKMKIDTQNMSIWYGSNNDLVPSICIRKGHTHLVVPRAVFVSFKVDRNAFLAMIAHEFGHLKQNDLKTWVSFSQFLIPYCNCMTTSIILNVILFSSIGLFGGSEAKGDVLQPIYFIFTTPWIAFRKVKLFESLKLSINKISQRSEILADLAAIIYSSGDSLISALEHYEHSAVWNPNPKESNYPSLPMRIELIRRHMDTIKGDLPFSFWLPNYEE